MKYDFEIYINIIAILFSFYVFLTFSEKKKYIENLAAGFALYLIALSLLLFNDSIISKTGEVLYYILLKSAYFASPFFIYNAIREFANKKAKLNWLVPLIGTIVWITISEILSISHKLQLIPLVFFCAFIYIYTAQITARYKQIGAPLRILSTLILLTLSAMFIYVSFVDTADGYEFMHTALHRSILVIISLMVLLIMMYFQKIRIVLIEQQTQIVYLNYHDETTGLYNKMYFDEKKDIFEDPNNYPISGIVIDSSVLSIVNSKYGIFSNDQVLKEAAKEFRKIKKKNELFYKLGNEVILILLLKTGYDAGKKRAEDYHNLIEMESDERTTGFMFGIGVLFNKSSDPYGLVEEALSNLYINKLIHNKNYINNFIVYFSSKIHQLEGKSEERLSKLKKMAINLGYKIGIDENDMNYLSKICDLYDIGKIAIPYRILEKREPLNKEEWEIIEKYPEHSYDIVFTVYGDKKLAEAVRAVRERWDGKGYPNGISGDKIPRISRILSIVESFDAMTNSIFIDRKNVEDSIAEIKKNRGTQYDPTYVDIFVEYMKDKFEL